ncbi:MAG TPA: mechanosensitive ion channel family protein [Bacillota bacterium]|nr:mechanosensitive ion channel family protein [Bacillota bacterium]HPU74963.1 mechanosensitive ion channel family protein [Bacillota bacterium]
MPSSARPSVLQEIMTGTFTAGRFTEGTSALVSSLIRIGMIVLISALIMRVVSKLIDRLFQSRENEQRALIRDNRRLMTLRTVIKSLVRYAVYFIGGIMVLGELGVNTSGLVAGAGIAGVALGFGAQNLVRDVLTGFFILFEDQFAVGDYVSISGVSGVVEDIGLRVTKVRDFAGQLHVVPNGSINLVTNFRGRAMRVMFDVQVPYSTDVELAIRALQDAFDSHRESMPEIVDGPTVLGVQDLGDSGIALRVWATAQPMQQWSLERQLKLLVKKVFDNNDISVAYPHRYVIIDGQQNSADTGSVGPGLKSDRAS